MRDHLISLGMKIKAFRKERKLTLQEFAEKTALSPGLLSKIENFRTIPSLPVLVRIAAALEVDMAELFSGISFREQPKWLLIHSEECDLVEREESVGLSYRPLLETSLEASALQVMLVTVAPGARRAPVSSEADEMLYLLSGELRYHLGDNEVLMVPGDLLYFDGSIPHFPANPGPLPVLLLVCYLLRKNSSA